MNNDGNSDIGFTTVPKEGIVTDVELSGLGVEARAQTY
jgi:hypothetical protein